LQGHQAGVLVLIHIEDDGGGGGVQDVARGQVAVGLQQHFERKGHMQ
jgi:hypothetical protein